MNSKYDLTHCSSLPQRAGPRPSTTAVVPHAQIDQLSGSKIVEALWNRLSGLESVSFRQSRMASSEAAALRLLDGTSNGPKDAFIDDHEFCHFHCSEGGYLHMALPMAYAQMAVKSGWGEIHLLADAGSIARTIHLIYAPRMPEEVEVVVSLVLISRDYARGVPLEDHLKNLQAPPLPGNHR